MSPAIFLFGAGLPLIPLQITNLLLICKFAFTFYLIFKTRLNLMPSEVKLAKIPNFIQRYFENVRIL